MTTTEFFNLTGNTINYVPPTGRKKYGDFQVIHKVCARDYNCPRFRSEFPCVSVGDEVVYFEDRVKPEDLEDTIQWCSEQY